MVGKMPAHKTRLSGILDRKTRGLQDRVGHEQVALDMAPSPREKLETRFDGVRRWKGERATIAVQHAQAPRGHAFRSKGTEVVYGPGGLAPPENHRSLHEGTRQIRCQAPRPSAQDLAIAGPLDIEHEPAGRSLFAAGAGSLGRQHVDLR